MPRWSFTYRSALVVLTALVLAGCPTVPLPDTRPEANFTADPRSGNTGTTVTFTDLSTTISGEEILSWQWNFGDGSRSNAPNPVHTYLVSGDFTVSLTVVSSGGSHTRTRSGYIQISSPSGSDELDSAGGTVSANNVSITVPEGALETRVEFGITRTSAAINFNAFETINRVGDTFELTHNSTTPLSTSSESDPIQPAVLSVPYTEDAVPTGSRLSANVHIVAQLESGEVIPILGTIRSGRVEAMVSDLPRRALYTVIYRPDAYLATATANSKAPTTTDWAQTWNVSLSPALLEQLTALRLGDIMQESSFFERDFTEAELAATETALLEGIVSMQEQFETVQSRAPRLMSRNGAYAVHCFNFLALYGTPPGIEDVLYAGRPFGSIVIDPRQLLALSAWNASRLADDAANADIGFVVAANRAFSEELARAVVDGYDYPDVTVASPSDGADVHFAAGIEDGLALYLGQMAQGMDASRSQLAGDFALVSTPLLSPIDLSVPGYSHASQEFYRYIDNRYAPASALGYIAGGTGSIKGLLEEIRLSLEELISPGYEEVAERVSVAIDDALLERLDVSLGDAYFNYALDLAFEHGPNSLLRPSDDTLFPLVLDESRFGAGTVFSGTLAGPDSGLDFPQSGATGLTAISPLSTRAIVVAADPSAASLTFEFNREEWAADARGRSVEVVVYREGLPGTPLGAEESALVFTDFEADAGRDMAFFYVLVVNTSISTPNSVELSVISSSTAPEAGASG